MNGTFDVLAGREDEGKTVYTEKTKLTLVCTYGQLIFHVVMRGERG